MKTNLLSACIGALVLFGTPAHGAEVEGVKLADRVHIADGGAELLLNGAGVRTRVLFKIYVGALYLNEKKTSADAVLSDAGPKRVMMHILRDELTAEQLVSAFNDGLTANHTPTELARLDSRIKELSAIMNSVKTIKKGGMIFLDCIPGTGTQITINGEIKGTIPGEDFNRALLKIWLGEKPVDASLKKAMLGGG